MPAIIPVNRYSKWANKENDRNNLMRSAFYNCESSLQTQFPLGVPSYSNGLGMEWNGSNLLFNSTTYDSLGWDDKVLAYNQLDSFFKSAVLNYHVTNNV